MRTKGHKCYNIKCGACVGKTLCGLSGDEALTCDSRVVHRVEGGGTNMSEWISVKERLPEDAKDEYVLVACNYHGEIIVETRKKWNLDSSVTHWMPLPEPPKEG